MTDPARVASRAAPRVARAEARARALAAHAPHVPTRVTTTTRAPTRVLAIGDPQAPLPTFLAILDAHDALDDDGWLRDDTALISMGDHFDWGRPEERTRAVDDSLALLSWLAAHPASQVTILAGNHDLARVGELHGVDDALFARAQALADRAYHGDDLEAEARFLDEHPHFPTAEVVARDLSAFRAVQRSLVQQLLGTQRMRLAHAVDDVLFVHAGVTMRELHVLGLTSPDATRIAAGLNAALDDAFTRTHAAGERLSIPDLHTPGDRTIEGGGVLYHRPTLGLDDEERHELQRPPLRRRFHPTQLPRGLVQVVGHIRDSKCRKLLASAADAHPAQDGLLRTLLVHDDDIRYARGLRPAPAHAAAMLFVDGGMNQLRDRPADYELLDVNTRTVAARASS